MGPPQLLLPARVSAAVPCDVAHGCCAITGEVTKQVSLFQWSPEGTPENKLEETRYRLCQGGLAVNGECPEIVSGMDVLPEYCPRCDNPYIKVNNWDHLFAPKTAILNGWKMNLNSWYHFLKGSGEPLTFSLTDAMDGVNTHPKPVKRVNDWYLKNLFYAIEAAQKLCNRQMNVCKFHSTLEMSVLSGGFDSFFNVNQFSSWSRATVMMSDTRAPFSGATSHYSMDLILGARDIWDFMKDRWPDSEYQAITYDKGIGNYFSMLACLRVTVEWDGPLEMNPASYKRSGLQLTVDLDLHKRISSRKDMPANKCLQLNRVWLCGPRKLNQVRPA